MSLLNKYRPRTLGDVLGQAWITEQLRLFLEAPHANAFIFAGDTGTGKTSLALALAEALGVPIDEAEMGGLYQIASGEQTGESVRKVMDALWKRPFMGSGWRVLIVNEADAMTANAAYTWLDTLEHLPPQSVVIFTTNAAHKIPARLRDRCEVYAFESGLLLRPALQELAEKVWQAETGRDDCPDVEAFGPLFDETGAASFRRLLQLMTPYIRSKTAPKASAPAKAIITPSLATVRTLAAKKAWETRRRKMAVA